MPNEYALQALQTEINRLSTEVTRLGADVAGLTVMVKEMKRELMGNGQPGKLAKIDAAIEEVCDRTTALEGHRKTAIAWVGGALFVLHFITGNGALTLASIIALAK